ncbi:uncharacterized protein LOC128625837 [Artibeus jamaicensis]|uniref:uncharacterized protein LOC128625837 n=1 Tax=Artibeus jamaicensis TaxID=9417 RepID=UPI00235B0342|nr:uncharacterized protein LOC128625837 [Artibeus jamaicensis]
MILFFLLSLFRLAQHGHPPRTLVPGPGSAPASRDAKPGEWSPGHRGEPRLPPSAAPTHPREMPWAPGSRGTTREFSSAFTCEPRTPRTLEILDLNPPKAKTSALAPQFSSCGPQQATRPDSMTSSVRGLQSKSTWREGPWASPDHRTRALASLPWPEGPAPPCFPRSAFGLRDSHTGQWSWTLQVVPLGDEEPLRGACCGVPQNHRGLAGPGLFAGRPVGGTQDQQPGSEAVKDVGAELAEYGGLQGPGEAFAPETQGWAAFGSSNLADMCLGP